MLGSCIISQTLSLLWVDPAVGQTLGHSIVRRALAGFGNTSKHNRRIWWSTLTWKCPYVACRSWPRPRRRACTVRPPWRGGWRTLCCGPSSGERGSQGGDQVGCSPRGVLAQQMLVCSPDLFALTLPFPALMLPPDQAESWEKRKENSAICWVGVFFGRNVQKCSHAYQ